MDRKVRIDLSSPPPVPTEEPVKAPPAAAELPQTKQPPGSRETKKEEKPEQPKKRGSLVLGILAVAAAAAALLGGYRFVHFWSEPTCLQKARCSICGQEKGGLALHSYQDGVCTVCGAEQTDGALDFGAWSLEEADAWLADFAAQSSAYGYYLAGSREDAPLRGVDTPEEAACFATPWRMCGVSITSDGAVLDRGAEVKFVADRYSGANGDAYVFRFDGWYLTMNAGGGVFLTDTLDEGCFWIAESAPQ